MTDLGRYFRHGTKLLGFDTDDSWPYPSAPIIGVATLIENAANVSFAWPASNGSDAIRYFTATSSPGGLTAIGSSSPLVVEGLSDGVSYTFTVRASSAVGNSAESAASNAVTPEGEFSILGLVNAADDGGDYLVSAGTTDTGGTTPATTGQAIACFVDASNHGNNIVQADAGKRWLRVDRDGRATIQMNVEDADQDYDSPAAAVGQLCTAYYEGPLGAGVFKWDGTSTIISGEWRRFGWFLGWDDANEAAILAELNVGATEDYGDFEVPGTAFGLGAVFAYYYATGGDPASIGATVSLVTEEDGTLGPFPPWGYGYGENATLSEAHQLVDLLTSNDSAALVIDAGWGHGATTADFNGICQARDFNRWPNAQVHARQCATLEGSFRQMAITSACRALVLVSTRSVTLNPHLGMHGRWADFASIVLSVATSLELLSLVGSQCNGSPPSVAANLGLKNYLFNKHPNVTGNIQDFGSHSALAAHTTKYCGVTGWAGTTWPASLVFVEWSHLLSLPESEFDRMLTALAATGTQGGELKIIGMTPGAAGETAISVLEGYGSPWTVTRA